MAGSGGEAPPSPDLEIVLVSPEIPQNTGNIGRLCVNLGARLHLVQPLGFSLDERARRRAGLDYWPHLDLRVHDDWQQYRQQAAAHRRFLATTHAARSLYTCSFRPGDHLVFGCETAGLPEALLRDHAQELFTIPMPGEHRRSLNLANAVAVAAYEFYRQLHG